MKKTINERVCDGCGKAVQQSEVMFGGSPFGGWLSVLRTDGSTHFPKAINGPWDFCSKACCIKFLSIDLDSSKGEAE